MRRKIEWFKSVSREAWSRRRRKPPRASLAASGAPAAADHAAIFRAAYSAAAASSISPRKDSNWYQATSESASIQEDVAWGAPIHVSLSDEMIAERAAWIIVARLR